MGNESIVFSLFLIFFGAAIMATLALTLRQSLIIAYIAVGLLIGPFGSGLIQDPSLIQNISNVGIIFLLFLLGLDLNPKELIRLAGETTLPQNPKTPFTSNLITLLSLSRKRKLPVT